jgi:hypothetical protein
MRRDAGHPASKRRPTTETALAAAMLTLCLLGTAAAQDDVTFIPAAPPEGAELAYDIPLPEWMVPPVLELKTRFSDGLSAEFTDIAENQTGGGIQTLVESGEQLAAGGERLRAAITSISEIDVTFGIDGISRIIPAEGAIRDTLFGFVVWHETSTMNSKGVMKRFEDLVEAVVSGGEACGGLARQLSTLNTQLNEALAAGDMDRVAALAPNIVETSVRVDAVCRSVADSAGELAGLVDQLSEDSGAQLAQRWAEAKAAVVQCEEPARSTGEAYESVSKVLYLMIELGRLLDGATDSVRAVETAPVEDGKVYIPWTVMRNDWKLVEELEERILAAPEAPPARLSGDGQTEAHAEGVPGAAESGAEAEHEHSHEIPGQQQISGATDETKRNIRSLYAYQVGADGILAHRAVEYTSAVVGRAMDRLEAFYKVDAHYDPSQNERRQMQALAKVDEAMRENLPLVSARLSAAGARAALLAGDREASMGAGHEVDALYQYQNAWLHALNAGNAAQRSVLEIHEH